MKTLAVATLVAVLAIPALAAAEKKKSFWSKVGFVAGAIVGTTVATAVCVGTGPLCAAGIGLAATGSLSGAGALVDEATGRDWQVTAGTGSVPIGKADPPADPPSSSPPETSVSEVVTETREAEEVADPLLDVELPPVDENLVNERIDATLTDIAGREAAEYYRPVTYEERWKQFGDEVGDAATTTGPVVVESVGEAVAKGVVDAGSTIAFETLKPGLTDPRKILISAGAAGIQSAAQSIGEDIADSARQMGEDLKRAPEAQKAATRQAREEYKRMMREFGKNLAPPR